MLVCAFLVAFFPILSNTALGLVGLFELYRASRWSELVLLRLPSALPYVLGGLRIGGGLALIGAIVAELAAGAAGQGSGLAFRITEAGYRLNIPRMFAALVLISSPVSSSMARSPSFRSLRCAIGMVVPVHGQCERNARNLKAR